MAIKSVVRPNGKMKTQVQISERPQVTVRIVGLTPLLMNNPASMVQGNKGGRKVIPTPEEEAASKAYWDDDHRGLVLHAEHIMGTLLEAAKLYKSEESRKLSVVPILAGGLDVQPWKIPLVWNGQAITTYDIDVRSVVVQRQRVHRARACIFPWEAAFVLQYRPEDMSVGFVRTTLKEIMERAGTRVGLLDFRPQHKGRFGQFKVEQWEM